ncbi:MAG TPA: HDOD domain-containing protein [Labilithrix sp.]|nr:HDOD domain-containing protein [Labilithrix sp.]
MITWMGDRWLDDDNNDLADGRQILLDTESREAKELKAKLLTLFRSPGYTPPVLPKVAVELMAMTRRPEVKTADIVHLLGQDALIAAKVLKVAQSPVYSRGAPVQSLHDAIVRMGIVVVRDICFEASMAARVFRAPGYDAPMERLRLHSSATAHVARLVCRHTRLRDDHAFLCGLLHDAGMVAAMIALASTQSKDRPVPEYARVAPVVASIHAEVGATLCLLWGMPDVARVVGAHHGPVRGEPIQRLSAAVRVAEQVASDLGFGMNEQDQGHAWAVGGLNLSAAVLASIAAEAKELLADLR